MSRTRLVTVVFALAVLGGFVAWVAPAPSPTRRADTPLARTVADEAASPHLEGADAKEPEIEHAPAPATPRTAGAGDVVDLCGVGRMPLPVGTPIDTPPAWPTLPTPLGAAVMNAAQAQVMVRLAAGSDRQRAAALLILHFQSEDAEERVGLVAQLVAIERAARDPAISAWTVAICESSPVPCDADIARRWTELEPDNAAAWIALSRHPLTEPDELDRALAQSTRYKVHFGALAAAVRKAWPEGDPPYLQLPVLLQGIGVDGAASMALLQPAAGYCKSPPPDSARAAGCMALAESMVQHGDTVMSHKLAIAIGQRIGWPAERLSALNAEFKTWLGRPSAFSDHQPYACENIERVRGWIDAVDQAGEKASVKAALPARG